MLNRLMKDLNELNRLAQVYHQNQQWVLLEKVMVKINDTTTMIDNYLDKNELEVPEDEQILS